MKWDSIEIDKFKTGMMLLNVLRDFTHDYIDINADYRN